MHLFEGSDEEHSTQLLLRVGKARGETINKPSTLWASNPRPSDQVGALTTVLQQPPGFDLVTFKTEAWRSTILPWV